MTKLFAVTSVVALLCVGVSAQANVFNLGAGYTNLETVRVGGPGNAGELSGAGAGGSGASRICGSVDHNYNIGKYEVTAKQYCDFLNQKAKSDPHRLYDANMGADHACACYIHRSGSDGSYVYSVADDWANRPVNYVSYWDACRFVNWLGNGQGDGDTETGAYTLNGYDGTDGRGIQRNAGWQWALPSEDEWYKAAYYDPNKAGGAGYWDYPTRSNIAPGNQVAHPDPGNQANYWNNRYAIASPYWQTNVGEFENSASAYGTFDQGGNVFEWNEAVVYEEPGFTHRAARGGSMNNDSRFLRAADRGDSYWNAPSQGESIHGFRVVQAVPEPSSIVVLLGGLAAFLGFRRRRA